MASAKSCTRLAGNPFLQDAGYFHSSLRQCCSPTRPYSSNHAPAKPRPYADKPKPRPLVGLRTPAAPNSTPSNPSPATAANPPPNINPKAGGVAYPYIRISIGVVLCGSIMYSMVATSLLPFFPKLTYIYTSSPLPSNSKPPPSQTETPLPSGNQA